MVLGPSGCGKSTALSQLAAEAFKTSPTLLIGLRHPSGRLSTQSEASCASARLEEVAQQFYSQINYPGRRALVVQMLKQGSFKLKAGTAEASLALHTQDRFVDALKTVFSVGESLCIERTRVGFAYDMAPPALLFDEVQDLIKDERLASVGGRYVFDELAVLLVRYGVDRKVVHTAVAGSSAMLAFEFEKTVAHGARWSHHFVLDPEEPVVMAALKRSGYDSAEAANIVQLCGSRLRLLSDPLAKGAGKVSASTFCSKMAASAKRQFRDTLRQLPSPSDAACLAAVLDRVERAEIGMEKHPTMRALDEYGDGTRRPTPLSPLVSKVLFLRLDYTFVFQSKLHRRAWAEVRGEYSSTRA
jgi:energy-coupling factor transporter ATP-binding protein EcfA2